MARQGPYLPRPPNFSGWHEWAFPFNGAFIGPNQQSRACSPIHFAGVSEPCLFDISEQIHRTLIILPTRILRTCQLGSVKPRSSISQEIAPAGRQTLFREVASHTGLFRASLMSSSHCTVQTACAGYPKHAITRLKASNLPGTTPPQNFSGTRPHLGLSEFILSSCQYQCSAHVSLFFLPEFPTSWFDF